MPTEKIFRVITPAGERKEWVIKNEACEVQPKCLVQEQKKDRFDGFLDGVSKKLGEAGKELAKITVSFISWLRTNIRVILLAMLVLAACIALWRLVVFVGILYEAFVDWLTKNKSSDGAWWMTYFLGIGIWLMIAVVYFLLIYVKREHRIWGVRYYDFADFFWFLALGVFLAFVGGLISAQVASWLASIVPWYLSIIIPLAVSLLGIGLIKNGIYQCNFDEKVWWIVILAVILLVSGVKAGCELRKKWQTEREESLRQQAVERLKCKARILVEHSSWGWSNNEFHFSLQDMGNCGVVLNKAEVRIWKLQEDNESPQSFKQRQPFFWTRDVHFEADSFQCMEGSIKLENYRAWLQDKEWIEIKLFGKDERGNELIVLLEAYDE